MHGIKNMEKHQVSPFGMFSLADRVWTDLVEERTREVFQSIYDAVKKRDTDALNKILSCRHYVTGHAQYYYSNPFHIHEKPVFFSCKDTGCNPWQLMRSIN